MNDQLFVEQILSGDAAAQGRFIERYSDAILQGVLRKCRPNCFRRNCPMRFGLTPQNLERTRCDELAELYTFSLESLLKGMKSYRGAESLDDWVRHQTRPEGLPFRQRFAAYMGSKYPITGRARIPDRFRHRWTAAQKRVFQEWLRQHTVSEIAIKVKVSEGEVMTILEALLAQLTEAGLLGALEEGVRLETFQQRERRIDETARPHRGGEASLTDEESDGFEPLLSLPRPQVEASDRLLVQALQHGVEAALSELSAQERRLLALKFDAEWTLGEIAQQSDALGLGKLTIQQVGHAIDNILRQMLPTINRALAGIEEVNLQLPALKRVLLEWGTGTGEQGK